MRQWPAAKYVQSLEEGARRALAEASAGLAVFLAEPAAEVGAVEVVACENLQLRPWRHVPRRKNLHGGALLAIANRLVGL